MDLILVFFVKQKRAYEVRISDWSSDVCSSDLVAAPHIGLDDDTALAIFSADLVGTVDHADVGNARQRHERAAWRRHRNLAERLKIAARAVIKDRKSVVEGTSGSVRVDLGGRRIFKKKTQ